MDIRDPINEIEATARRRLAITAKAILEDRVTYIEGAPLILSLWSQIGGARDHDEDIIPFQAIASETDHLPLDAQKHLWSSDALEKLESEYEQSEKWAIGFAYGACKRLVTRFKDN